MVDVEVVDRRNHRCPTALNKIDFSLNGEAEWRGGIAHGPNNYILSTQLPVENGINRILLRSTTTAGKITLTAKSPNLQPASIEFRSRPFPNADGLSTEMPDENLPSVLARGATPSGESYGTQRRPLDIVRADAGSNQGKAALSFDDDETTAWTSDGPAERAWIRYELGQSARVHQAVLKLSGARTKTYPIKISVDGKGVFAGSSPRNLGYASFSFAPVKGKAVKIELTGKKGSLAIVEAEFYGPVLN
jgi:beta-galactosidase